MSKMDIPYEIDHYERNACSNVRCRVLTTSHFERPLIHGTLFWLTLVFLTVITNKLWKHITLLPSMGELDCEIDNRDPNIVQVKEFINQ